MLDLFGRKAKAILYELGKASAHRHVHTMQNFVSGNLLSECPDTVKVPLSFVLSGNFVEEPGPEWKHRSFEKGFIDLLQGFTVTDVKLVRVKEGDVAGQYLRARGKFVPIELLCVNLVIVQTKRFVLPAPQQPDNVIRLGARVV